VCVESIDGSSTRWQNVIAAYDAAPLNLDHGRHEPEYWGIGIRCP